MLRGLDRCQLPNATERARRQRLWHAHTSPAAADNRHAMLAFQWNTALADPVRLTWLLAKAFTTVGIEHVHVLTGNTHVYH
jgi:hypothetical protein